MTLERVNHQPSEIAPALAPRELVAIAKERATVLMEIVEERKLFSIFNGKKYLEAEAWQTIVAFDDACPVTEWTREMKDDSGATIGYLARVNIMKRGEVIASGEMSCGFEEFPCRGKAGIAKHRAAMSAAQTWAGAKAARMKYAWVAVLAGYQPTPAAEMDQGDEPEAAERGLCPVHQVAFAHRQGTSKAGKAYDFWSCPERVDNGWCQERPPDEAVEAAIAAVEAQTPKPPVQAKPVGQQEADVLREFRQETERLQWTDGERRKFIEDTFGVTGWVNLSVGQKRYAVERLKSPPPAKGAEIVSNKQ